MSGTTRKAVFAVLLLLVWIGAWLLTMLVIGNAGLASNSRWSDRDLNNFGQAAIVVFVITYCLAAWLVLRRRVS